VKKFQSEINLTIAIDFFLIFNYNYLSKIVYLI